MPAVDFWPDERVIWPLPEDLSISQWAEKYRVLSAHSSIKGPYLLEMVPFFAWLMDQIQKPEIQTIVLCKPAQIGGTDFALSVLGYYAHQEGASIMCVLADQDTAEYVSNEKIKVMINSSEAMHALVDKDCWTKNEMKLLNGAYFSVAWASSVAKLASRPIRIVMLDEIDKPGYSITSREANPISLARERSNTFPDRKILIMSTPTDDQGNITKEMSICDAIFDWHVPCTACNLFQPLRWSAEHCYGIEKSKFLAENGKLYPIGEVVWDGGSKASNRQVHETARYKCGACNALWSSSDKNNAVRAGKAVPRAPLTGWERKIALHVNRIYSLFDGGRLEELVLDFVHAHRTPETERHRALQGFINSSLAEPWVPSLSLRKESAILALRDHRPPGIVPSEGVLGLTAGGDTQDDGFYFTIYAWGQYDAWLVREGFVDNFDVLKLILSGRYLDSSGNEYVVNFALIDAMGHRTAEIYENLRGLQHIKPSRGEQRMANPYAVTQIDHYPGTSKPIQGGLRLYRINASYFKDKLHAKLGISPGDPGAFHFHSDIGDAFAKQMTAETRNEKESWECPPGKANHYWDCSYLALAAADIIGIKNWGQTTKPTNKPHDKDQGPNWISRPLSGWLRR